MNIIHFISKDYSPFGEEFKHPGFPEGLSI